MARHVPSNFPVSPGAVGWTRSCEAFAMRLVGEPCWAELRQGMVD